MCGCATDIEKRLTDHHAKQTPKGRGHEVTLRGYGFVIETASNEVKARGYMPYETFAYMPLKAGGEKAKRTTGNMYFTFCPFCGVKYD